MEAQTTPKNNSSANKIYTKFVMTNIDSCARMYTNDITPSSTYLKHFFFHSSTKLKFNPFRVTQYYTCWSFFLPLNSFQFAICLHDISHKGLFYLLIPRMMLHMYMYVPKLTVNISWYIYMLKRTNILVLICGIVYSFYHHTWNRF